ncbi:MAG: hypothetical protein KKI09_10895 [Spirochaetes bacterium]|nr:hypothetical protein [Spirochaetota bacterium]
MIHAISIHHPRTKKLSGDTLVLCGIILAIFVSILALSSCQTKPPADGILHNLSLAEAYFTSSFLNASEPYYDASSPGHWGHDELEYRTPLRNSYFRADAYRALAGTSYPHASTLQFRANAVPSWFKLGQDEVAASPTAKGLMFIPYEPTMPEFGAEMLADYTADPSAVYGYTVDHSGWYVRPKTAGSMTDFISAAFYDHGRALVSLCRSRDAGDSSVDDYIDDAADWLVAQDAATRTGDEAGGYVNYYAAGVEGLARAYKTRGTAAYLNTALAWYKDFVLIQQNSDGSFGESHDRMARYHGYILSSLGQLLYSLPPAAPEIPALKAAISKARDYLRDLTSQSSPDGSEYDWTGICARTWAELHILASLGYLPDLTAAEIAALDNCLLRASQMVKPLEYTGYNRIKAAYHAEQVAWVVAAFAYGAQYY